MKASSWAHIAVLVANLIYGINYTVAKGLMPDIIGPSGFILLRVLGASLLFWLLYLTQKMEKVERKDLLRLIGCAAAGVACNQLFFFNGLNLTTPINAAIIMTSNPILVLCFAAIIIKERLNAQKIIGIALGAAGAIWLILQNGSLGVQKEQIGIGNLFIFLNAASYAIYLVLVKPLMKKYKPITIITYVFSIGCLFVLPFGFNQLGEVDWAGLDLSNISALAFVVIGTTFLAYLLNIFGLKTLNPSSVSSYIYLQPLFAALIAIPFGADELRLNMVLAGLLIISGVYLVTNKKLSPRI